MSYLYVTDNKSRIGVESNYVTVRMDDYTTRKIPIETLESISIFGKAQITTQCFQECLERGIPVSFYSKKGRYFGMLQSTGHVHVERQRLQAKLYESDFALELAKRIIECKIINQEVLLRRYARNTDCEVEEQITEMKYSVEKMDVCRSVEQIMGYEGIAAKHYFKALSNLVVPEFRFNGRSRRPPKDEFNSMLSLGYSLVMTELYGKIQNKGLNPYFGFIHRDREKHPTLASDLMEEWRAIIVDSVVMSLVNGHEIFTSHFTHDMDEPGYYLTSEGMKIFLNKMEAKLHTDNKYLAYVDYSVSFRKAMELQVNQLVKAIESEDASIYQPVRIR